MKRGVYKISLILLLVFTGIQSLSAQDTASVSQPKRKIIILSPLKATMLAAAFPGAGQIYTRKYWKVPIVYGGFGGLGYAVSYNTKWYKTYTKAYQDFTDKVLETDSYVSLIRGVSREVYDPMLNSSSFNDNTSSYVQDQLLNQVDYFRRYRDLSLIGLGAWYLITILDANVDASLFNYDVGENLNLSVAPFQFPLYNYSAFGVSVSMKINF
ncbi:MAG: DUF5683 domain-containing protein [Bacteroidales bacterium]